MVFIGIIIVSHRRTLLACSHGLCAGGGPRIYPVQCSVAGCVSPCSGPIGRQKIEAILARNRWDSDNYTTIVGYSILTQTAGPNISGFFISLKEWKERAAPEQHAFKLVEALNRRFANEIPQATVYAFGPPAIQGLGTGAGFTFMLQDRSGNSPAALAEMADRFMAAARKRPEIGKIATFYRSGVPQFFADVDRDRVLKQGVTLGDVNTTLGSLLGSNYINDFNRFGRVYKVYMSAEGDYRNETWKLGQFAVRNNQGAMVPLNTLVTMRPIAGPEYTNRFNLPRSAELTGVPATGYSSDQALAALREVAAEVLPQGWSYDWSNMSYQEVKAAGQGAVVFGFALLFVFLILAAQYESWSLPLSVLLATPFVVFGAMLGLWLMRFFSDSYTNNVFAQIGFVTLIGLSAKNAILIVEFAKMKKEEGLPAAEAALEAAKLRLRPILMTSFAFILGVVPLVRAAGAGAESRKVMGLAVFAGLLVATTLAIYLVPMLFTFVERFFVKGKRTVPAAPEPAGHSHEGQQGGHS